MMFPLHILIFVTPTGLPWVCFITTMQLPNRTGSLARSGRQRRLANPESASGL